MPFLYLEKKAFPGERFFPGGSIKSANLKEMMFCARERVEKHLMANESWIFIP